MNMTRNLLFQIYPLGDWRWHLSELVRRNRDLFSRAWQAIPESRYGAEAYPSMMFKDGEAHCLFANNFQGSPYDIDNMNRILST